MPDEQDESITPTVSPSNRRETLPDLVFSNDQSTVFLADDVVRAAAAFVVKNSAPDETQKLSCEPRIRPLREISGVGAVRSTVAVALNLARDIKSTGIRSAPVLLQIPMTLLHQAPEASEQSLADKKSDGKESEHYETKNGITPALKVLKKPTAWQ